MFDVNKAGELAKKVIVEHIEGGYYHPDFYIKGAKTIKGGYISPNAFKAQCAPNCPGGSAYDYYASGETMYGLDRTAGHSDFYTTPQPNSILSTRTLCQKKCGKPKKVTFRDPQKDLQYIYTPNYYKYIDNEAKEFWSTLDRLDARHTFPHEYMGGVNKDRLMELCGRMMYRVFMKEYYPYLPAEIQKGINEDDALAVNVFYTAWNGTGWREWYKNSYNALKAKNPPKTNSDINRLYLKARYNVGGARDGDHMLNAIQKGLGINVLTYGTSTSTPPISSAKKKLSSFLLIAGASALIIFALKRKK